MLAARSGATALITTILATAAAPPPPPPVLSPHATFTPAPPAPALLLGAADADGNTPLHHAAAQGHLKALRALLAAGADATAPNARGASPVAVSRTREATEYFVSLVMEVEKRRGEEQRGAARRRAGEGGGGGGGGGVRMVSAAEDEEEGAGGGAGMMGPVVGEVMRQGPTGLRKQGQGGGARSRAGTDD